jgi:hypothetical protein
MVDLSWNALKYSPVYWKKQIVHVNVIQVLLNKSIQNSIIFSKIRVYAVINIKPAINSYVMYTNDFHTILKAS